MNNGPAATTTATAAAAPRHATPPPPLIAESDHTFFLDLNGDPKKKKINKDCA